MAVVLPGPEEGAFSSFQKLANLLGEQGGLHEMNGKAAHHRFNQDEPPTIAEEPRFSP